MNIDTIIKDINNFNTSNPEDSSLNFLIIKNQTTLYLNIINYQIKITPKFKQ